MRVSYAFFLAISSALAIPIPSGYTWSFTYWSGNWYGAGWANFRVSSPQSTVSGVTIPTFSLTDTCHLIGRGGETSNCNDLIAGEKDGRTLEFTLRPFDNNIKEVQLDAVYRFTDGGRYLHSRFKGLNFKIVRC